MASIFPPCDERLLDAIRNASGAIIIAHKNPDGDAIASSLAARAILSRLGKKTLLLNDGPFLRSDIKRYENLFMKEADDDFISASPLVIVLDCSTPDRPGNAFDKIKNLKRVIIDHHSAGVPFADEGMSYIVPESPSTTLCLNQVRQALGVELDEEIASFLYMGFNLPGRLVMLAFIPIFVVMINSLYVKDKTDFGKFAFIYTALLYIAVPMTLTNFAVFRFIGAYDGVLLLCFFAIIWASDVGAYVFGITLGQKYGKKLFPAVSPKKSWIGFWGGLLLAVAVAVVLNCTGLFRYPLYHCIIMAVLMNIAGVYGDLIESQWKRHYAIKDSGSVIPGHGGIWDRFDSALMAIPAGVIYLVVLNIL